MQWDLVAAAVEAAVSKVFELGKEDAGKIRGRSRITFSKKMKRLLRDIADEDENADLLTRANWLKAAVGHHTRLANKLIMVERYMKNKTGDVQRAAEIQLLSYKTAAAYKELAGKAEQKRKAVTDPDGSNLKKLDD